MIRRNKMDFTFSLLLFSVISLVFGDEISDNTVEIKFYRLTTTIWNSKNYEIEFSGLISEGANTYCKSSPSSCGLVSVVSDFKEVDIGKVSGYPQDSEKDMIHQFYINYPTGSDQLSSHANRTVLDAATVIAIITNTREKIHTTIGYWITEADDEFYGIPPPTLANSIIIPIAFVVLFAVIILAVCLHFWNKRREKAERIQKKIEERKIAKNKAKVEPVKYVEGEEETKVPEVNRKVRQKKLVRDGYRRAEKSYDRDPEAKAVVESPRKSQGGASDADSAIKMDEGRTNGEIVESHPVGKYQSLPPLSSEIDDTPVRKERKKKKKKKHRHEHDEDRTTEL